MTDNLKMLTWWAERARKEASAAETDDAVPADEYVKKLKVSADAEIALMTFKWYRTRKTISEDEVKRLSTLRDKAQKRVVDRRPATGAGKKYGPKVGKKAAQRNKEVQLKKIQEYSAIIEKETAAAAMLTEEANRLVIATAAGMPCKAPMPSA